MIKSTGKFKVESVIYNEGGFAIASGYWDGKTELTTACRWHEADGIGFPQSFGKSQWMVLPNPSVKLEDSGKFAAPLITLAFGKRSCPFYSLEFIDDGTGDPVHSLEADSPFGSISIGDFISVPQARFPDGLVAKNGRQVISVQHIINKVDGQIWHSAMIRLAAPAA